MILFDRFGFLIDLYVMAYDKMIKLMNELVEVIASLDYLVFNHVFFSLPLVFISYMLLYLLINWLTLRTLRPSIWLMLGLLVLMGTLLIESTYSKRASSFVVFHQFKNSMMALHKGDRARVYSNTDRSDPYSSRILTDFKLKHFKLELIESKQRRHFFRIANKKIMVIDHDAINTDFGFEPDILVLVNSPKINLDRLINHIQPAAIIADGSNFYSFKLLWEHSAKSNGVVFHDTSKEGAFVLAQTH